MLLSTCQLPSCNLFTQHVSHLSWRDATSELWTPVHLLHLKYNLLQSFTSYIFLQVTIIFHNIQLTLCFQQAGEIDNLTVMLGQSLLVVLCAGVCPNPTCSITLVSFSGKTCCYTHHTFLLGYPNVCVIHV